MNVRRKEPEKLDFGNVRLFNKKPEDVSRIGARGARARMRNLWELRRLEKEQGDAEV